MTDRLRIALAQINPTLGDIGGNIALVRAAHKQAADAKSDLLMLPELATTGYPPEDLVLHPALMDAIRGEVEKLAAETGRGPGILLPTPWLVGGRVYNAALLLESGRIAGVTLKRDLPNYGVFDEKRVFAAGPLPSPLPFRGIGIGVPICEDIWTPEVCQYLAASGAEIILSPNGSPYEMDKRTQREQLASHRAAETELPLVYLNQVGGQDELVFDGNSFVMNADGKIPLRLSAFATDFAVTDWRREGKRFVCADSNQPAPKPLSRLESIYQAMMLGLGDYVNKNGFPGVVLGLSGGIDSALSVAVAVDALGPERVMGVMMPSRFTSADSLEDAAASAKLLGIRYETVAIEPVVDAFLAQLAPLFKGRARDVTEENLQSRIRGVILMALSNKLGPMVLTTGNKSEMSVGYATLYGDMCGGYSVLKDVYKTTVNELSLWRNAERPRGSKGPGGIVMPERVIAKPPSAELRDDQRDSDSLPPYGELDAILEHLVEAGHGVADIAGLGFAEATVERVQNLLYGAEYKRRQAPPGVKITRRNFGRDRRYPITNRFRDKR